MTSGSATNTSIAIPVLGVRSTELVSRAGRLAPAHVEAERYCVFGGGREAIGGRARSVWRRIVDRLVRGHDRFVGERRTLGGSQRKGT